MILPTGVHQFRAFVANARLLKYPVTQEMALLCAGFLALCLLAFSPWDWTKLLYGEEWMFVWPVATCFIYSLVHLDYRFIGSFAVLWWPSVYRMLSRRVDQRAYAAVLTTVGIGLMFCAVRSVPGAIRQSGHDLLGRGPASEQVVVAIQLAGLGLQPGDRIATVGHGFDGYYARLAALRLTAQIADPGSFWRLSEPDLRRLGEELRRAEVKAVVTQKIRDEAAGNAWQILTRKPFSEFSVLLLDTPESKQQDLE